jgi:hypothetical protein
MGEQRIRCPGSEWYRQRSDEGADLDKRQGLHLELANAAAELGAVHRKYRQKDSRNTQRPTPASISASIERPAATVTAPRKVINTGSGAVAAGLAE